MNIAKNKKEILARTEFARRHPGLKIESFSRIYNWTASKNIITIVDTVTKSSVKIIDKIGFNHEAVVVDEFLRNCRKGYCSHTSIDRNHFGKIGTVKAFIYNGYIDIDNIDWTAKRHTNCYYSTEAVK